MTTFLGALLLGNVRRSEHCAPCSGPPEHDCGLKTRASAHPGSVSAKYPVMPAAYAQGKCPQVDECTAELRSCTSQYSSGNDEEDCQEGSVSTCYSAADACTKQAAIKCGELQGQCPGSTATFVLLIGASPFFYGKQRQKGCRTCRRSKRKTNDGGSIGNKGEATNCRLMGRQGKGYASLNLKP